MIAIFDRHDGYLRLISRSATIMGALEELRQRTLMETDGLATVVVDPEGYELFLVTEDEVAALAVVGPGRARRVINEHGRRPL